MHYACKQCVNWWCRSCIVHVRSFIAHDFVQHLRTMRFLPFLIVNYITDNEILPFLVLLLEVSRGNARY